jgi:hypothetical protein
MLLYPGKLYRLLGASSLIVTHKGLKYLPIIEHIFYCITYFTRQVLSFIHAFVLHTNGLKVDADYIPELIFFSRDFGVECTNAGNIRSFAVVRKDIDVHECERLSNFK